jgi:photosystem II stability/assembly factor-like uncharacterized protein
MSGQRKMYLGTKEGVLVLGDQDGRWEHERTILPGRHVQSLAAPDGTQLMYAKLADGVYASSDSGHSWDHVFEGNVYYLHVDPSNPETIYAGMEPVALYRSQDCGDSWVEIDSLRRQPDAIRDKWWFPQFPYEGHVKHMHVEPRDSRRLYVALEHGGFLRSDDGGTTWEDVTDGVEYIDCHVVAGHPTRDNVVFGGTARGFYRSEDYGHNWIMAEDGLTRDDVGSFAVMGGAQPSLFLTATRGSPPSWVRPTGAESAVFRSNDDGQSWQELRKGLPDTIVRVAGGLRIDPIEQDRVYFSTSDFTGNYTVAGGTARGGQVWMSPDRGDAWTCVYESATPIQLLGVVKG